MKIWKDYLGSKAKCVENDYKNYIMNNYKSDENTHKSFDFNMARMKFDAEWIDLMEKQPKLIYKFAGGYSCCGRNYFFSEFKDILDSKEEIIIIIDGYEDISNGSLKKVLFTVKCELDINSNFLNYYDRNNNIFRTEKADNIDYDDMITTLMNEAVK